jgi:hypothetical protein
MDGILSSGDFNGDGRADVLTRNTAASCGSTGATARATGSTAPATS